MNKLARSLWYFFSGLLVLGTAIIITLSEDGPEIVGMILSVAVLLFALRNLALYFTTARFMVGGIGILFKGLIALNFAVFLLTLKETVPQYIMVYLVVIYFASGAIDLFRALEIRKLHDRSWKRKAVFGMINVIISVICLINISSRDLLCIIYGVGLALTGIRRISKAFKKEKTVYIQ